MADPEQLARIREGVASWNEWRSNNDHAAIDLRGANLSEADLSGAHLGVANLSRANLSVANLNRANLSGADSQRRGSHLGISRMD